MHKLSNLSTQDQEHKEENRVELSLQHHGYDLLVLEGKPLTS